MTKLTFSDLILNGSCFGSQRVRGNVTEKFLDRNCPSYMSIHEFQISNFKCLCSGVVLPEEILNVIFMIVLF